MRLKIARAKHLIHHEHPFLFHTHGYGCYLADSYLCPH